MSDTTFSASAIAPAAEKAEGAKASLTSQVSDKAKEGYTKVKTSFVKLSPASQAVALAGILIVLVSLIDHWAARFFLAVLGLVMVMITFSGVDINKIGSPK